MELPFAAIHQLCRPMLGRLDVLPEPQQRALAVALGLSSGKAPDRFLVAKHRHSSIGMHSPITFETLHTGPDQDH